MKRLIVIGIIGATVAMVNAQNESDALRYSRTFHGSTARSMGMAGAFGALGGDFSTLSSNPAGIGLYKGSEFVFTPKIHYNSADAFFNGSRYNDYKYNFGFSNLGFIYTYDYKRDEGWSTVSYGTGYNRLADFGENTTIRTEKANGSLLDEFVLNSNIEGSEERFDPFYEYLAYNTYLVNPDTFQVIAAPGDTSYGVEFWSHMTDSGKYGQLLEKTIRRKGGIGEWVFSMGANYSNKLYLGATIGWEMVNFSQSTLHYENDVDDNTMAIGSFSFREKLDAWGNGLNLKVGGIYKPTDALRIGLAFHTPTIYWLTEEFHTAIEANYDAGFDPSYSEDRSDVAQSDYTVLTPYKAMGSLAIVIGKRALFDVDYEFVDYTAMRLQGDMDSYTDINTIIQKSFKQTHNVRGGFEVRLDPIYLRGGYAYYDSPYKSSLYGNNSDVQYASGGIGYREANVSFDIAYSRALNSQKHYLFLGTNSKIDYTRNQILATLSFRF